MCLSTRVVSEVAGWRIVEHRHNTKTEKHRGEDAKAFNKSQIAKSNAGLTAAGGYGTAAAGADPTAGFQAIAANPMSAAERASRLGGIGTAYDTMGTQAAERTARTGNSAGYGSLLDELARGKARDVSSETGALDTEAFNRKMAALGGLQRQYGTDVSAQTSLLRPNQPVQEPGFWDNFVLTLMGNANKAAQGYAAGG